MDWRLENGNSFDCYCPSSTVSGGCFHATTDCELRKALLHVSPAASIMRDYGDNAFLHRLDAEEECQARLTAASAAGVFKEDTPSHEPEMQPKLQHYVIR